jgi:flagellar motor switch protein FliN/FliY
MESNASDIQVDAQIIDDESDTELLDKSREVGGAVSSTLFKPLSGKGKADTANDIDMILDIPVMLTVELGRTKLPIKNLLQLSRGSVIELNGMAGDPLDILVNGCLIAQGEVVVVNERFGIRLTDIITPSERIRKLNK